jgi:hypothetical protein
MWPALPITGYNVLHHPSYIPDFFSCDFHVFSLFKEKQKVRTFRSDEYIKSAIMWLQEHQTEFFTEGILAGALRLLHHRLWNCI